MSITSQNPDNGHVFHIIQSNDMHKLFEYLLQDYQSASKHIFEPFMVIVPSKVMGDWLKKQVADQTGVSTLVTAEFWGRYQWTLMQQVLQTYAKYRPREALRVPEVAVLSKNVMQWRLFGYLNAEKHAILTTPSHPLYPLLAPLIDLPATQTIRPTSLFYPLSKEHETIPKWLRKKSFTEKTKPQVHLTANKRKTAHETVAPTQDFQTASDDQRLWQLASDMASMLNRYMTYRPEWLNLWAIDQPVNVKQLIAKKDELNLKMAGSPIAGDTQTTAQDTQADEQGTTSSAPALTPNLTSVMTPDWLIEHYEQLEIAQRFVWRTLFDETYQYRRAIEGQFWQALNHQDPKIAKACRATLPAQLTLFTIQQLPKTELMMMAKLAKFINIKLLHYNPSEMFWADIVDKNWLAQQTLINPESIYYKDHGHTLLSRFGKQSREVFAMLADFSGNDYDDNHNTVEWTDDFVPIMAQKNNSQYPSQASSQAPSLLARLQQDILMLQEKETQSASKQVIENLFHHIEGREYKPTRAWQLSPIDNSLSIHACHSMVRQLEVLRAMIIGWLNYADKPELLTNPAEKGSGTDALASLEHLQARLAEYAEHHHAVPFYSLLEVLDKVGYTDHQLTLENRRSLSDILVLLPDIEAQQTVIESVFPKEVGTDGYALPAKVTGVTSKDINQLWSAITGFFTLLQTSHTSTSHANATTGQASGQSVARFDRASVFDWLMLPPLIESYGLSHEQMSRGCELLTLAGFARGFDEQHLATTLHAQDDDYRYSFAYALERLVAGLLMPNATTTQFGTYVNRYQETEKILPLAQVQMADSAVIAVLCDIYSTIDRLRDVGSKTATAEKWLIAFERFIKEKFENFMQTNALNSIWSALNSFDKNIQANQRYAQFHNAKNTAKKEVETAIDPNAPNAPSAPNTLKLKLGFILASIESELANQQVSAEPAGVITFGRIGAVRNLPYKLVVMLNMNLSNFPNRDKSSRYDLMQAGVSERGDRFKEDDELGAFLDAILSAKEACWLFYNGASTSDTHEHLPASPIQELIDFLQGEVTWHLSPQASTVEKNTPKLIQEWLVTKHPELPFDTTYFESPKPKEDRLSYQIEQIKHAQKPLYPPAPVWYSVVEDLQKDTGLAPLDKIEILGKKTLTNWLKAWRQLQRQHQSQPTPSQALVTIYTHLSVVMRETQQPAKTYVQSQQIHLSQYHNEGQNIEPIELDNLAKYHINASLLAAILTPVNPADKADSLHNLVFSNELPAGVSRYTSIYAQRQKIQHDALAFWEKLQTINPTTFPAVAKVIQQLDEKANLATLITPCQDQLFAIAVATLEIEANKIEANPQALPIIHMPSWQNYILTANLPTLQTTHVKKNAPIDNGYWINYLPTSGREKYQVQFWLSHLSWQIARHTTSAQVSAGDGFSLWQFSDKVAYYLPPIAYEQAYAWLQDWLMVWQLCKQAVVILPPSVVVTVLTRMQTDTKAGKPDIFSALAKTNWNINAYSQSEMIYEDDPRHLYWAFLLKDKDVVASIVPFISSLGEQLYTPMLALMTTLEPTVIEAETT